MCSAAEWAEPEATPEVDPEAAPEVDPVPLGCRGGPDAEVCSLVDMSDSMIGLVLYCVRHIGLHQFRVKEAEK